MSNLFLKFDAMDALGIIAIVVAILGIVGCFLPVVPGPPLSWVALLLVFFSDKATDAISTRHLIIWLIAATVITVADYVLPGLMAKATGGHKAAERGALLGLIAGLFLTPVGIVLGSFIGAFLGEFLSGGKDICSSLKVALGTFLAFILSTGIKVIFSVLVLWQVISHLF